jgi:hypothetical protein
MSLIVAFVHFWIVLFLIALGGSVVLGAIVGILDAIGRAATPYRGPVIFGWPERLTLGAPEVKSHP